MSTSRRYWCYLVRKKRGGGSRLPHLTLGKKLTLLVTGMSLAPSFAALAQGATAGAQRLSAQEIVDQILTFIYSLGHLIVVAVLPSLQFPSDLVDPIGLLAILTIFLAVATVAKKLVWIVVIVGWALILVRLILVIVQNYV